MFVFYHVIVSVRRDLHMHAYRRRGVSLIADASELPRKTERFTLGREENTVHGVRCRRLRTPTVSECSKNCGVQRNDGRLRIRSSHPEAFACRSRK